MDFIPLPNCHGKDSVTFLKTIHTWADFEPPDDPSAQVSSSVVGPWNLGHNFKHNKGQFEYIFKNPLPFWGPPPLPSMLWSQSSLMCSQYLVWWWVYVSHWLGLHRSLRMYRTNHFALNCWINEEISWKIYIKSHCLPKWVPCAPYWIFCWWIEWV